MTRRTTSHGTGGSTRDRADDGIDRRRVLQATAGAGLAATGIGMASGSALAQEEGDEDVPQQGLFDACLGEWEEAEGSMPLVDARDADESYAAENVPEGEDEVLFYVHGWVKDVTGGAVNQAYTLQTALEEEGYDHPVIAGMWPSNNPNWWDIKNVADDAATAFASWIDDYLEENPDTTFRLVGHSMGGYMSLSILDALNPLQTVDSVALLGASIDADEVCDDGAFAEGIEGAADEVYDYHSENDEIMCKIYRAGEFGDHGLGCGGSDCDGGWFDDGLPDNYEDVDVTESVDGHCSYMRPGGQGCVDQVVADFDAGEEDEDDGGLGGWFGGVF